ncbi:hypothetical protein B0H14DRAFT_2935711, partial [Mycena olivaceomarginata]
MMHGHGGMHMGIGGAWFFLFGFTAMPIHTPRYEATADGCYAATGYAAAPHPPLPSLLPSSSSYLISASRHHPSS